MNKKLFDGSLGVYPHENAHIKLKSGNNLCILCLPPTTFTQKAFKKALGHMVELSILEPCGASLWVSSVFIIPKRDGWIQQIIDLCISTKQLYANNIYYPLSLTFLIKSLLQIFDQNWYLNVRLHVWAWCSQPWTLWHCQALCKYQYELLPIGLKCAHYFVQQVMEEVSCNIKDTGAYLDDILVPFLWHGKTTFYSLAKYFTTLKIMASRWTHSNACEPYKKLIGLGFG